MTLLNFIEAHKIALGLVLAAAVTSGAIVAVQNISTADTPSPDQAEPTMSAPSIDSSTADSSGSQASPATTGTTTQPTSDSLPSTSSSSQDQSATSTSPSSPPSQAVQTTTINDVAVSLEEKQSGYCRALAPKDWAFTTNSEATGADLFAPDKTMHAGWGIAAVPTTMYPGVDDFLNFWMPLVGYTGFQMQSSEPLDGGFVKRDFTSGIGKQGFLIYKAYEFDPTLSVVSVYFAAADTGLWATQGALPGYTAISIRCVSQLRPSTSSVDVSSSNPSKQSDNPEVSLSDKWTEAIMGYENVSSPSTGDHYEAPLNSKWETGPEGSGYYRSLPGGGYEKLTPGFGNY